MGYSRREVRGQEGKGRKKIPAVGDSWGWGGGDLDLGVDFPLFFLTPPQGHQ